MALSLQEKIDAVEKACCAAAWRKADVIIEDRPGWFRTITPSTPLEAYNGVHYSVLKEAEAEAQIQSVIEDYRARGASFRWVLGPGSRPQNLGELLQAHGMTLNYELLGMVAEVVKLKPSVESGISVEEVTPATVGEYARACVAGWGQPKGNGELIESEMLRSYAMGDLSKIYYIARYQGQAAGTGVLMPLDKSGYLMASSVDPKFRGKGVYRGLVAKRLEVLRERGIPLVTIQAIADTSAPICKKLGFETVCQLAMYGWSPKPS